jgi:hypothetical protein
MFFCVLTPHRLVDRYQLSEKHVAMFIPDVVCSSENVVPNYETTRRHNGEERYRQHLWNSGCEKVLLLSALY